MSEPTPVGASAVDSSKPGRPAILVVDDEVSVCQLLRVICGDNYVIQIATAGAAAIELLKQGPIDVVISDFRMPGISGAEVLGQAAELQPEAVRIMMSGYAEAEIVIEAVNQGHIHYFLPKPFEEQEVINVLRQAMGYGAVLRERRELICQLEKSNRELEQRVQQRTAELRDAQRSAQIGSWSWIPGRHTAATSWSEELYQITGRDPSLPVPSYEEFCEMHTPESWARLNAAVIKALKERVSYELDLEMVRPDGTHRWVVTRGEPQCDGYGNVVQLRGTVQDITERKQMEQALREISEHRGLSLEAAELGTWDYHLDTGEMYWDPRRRRMFGYSADDPIHYNESLTHIHPEDRAAVHAAVCRAYAAEEDGAYRQEFRVIWPDGSVHWLAGFGRAYFAGEGSQRRAVRFIGVTRDITEQRFVQAELLKAKEAAEAADRAKSQFLANMSHEIRTPMNGVMGATELLLQTELNPEQQSYLEITRISGERMLEVINEILDFSKIEERQVVLDKESFDLRLIVRRAVELVSLEAKKKGLELTWQVAPEVPQLLYGDAGRISQILLNVVGNAVKFTPRGGVAIQVKTESALDETVTLQFSVTDTGIGIRPELCENIFSPFVQADGSTTRKFGGTGLGLAISRQLLELMGGRIGVESEEGKGSTFRFTAVVLQSPPASALAEPDGAMAGNEKWQRKESGANRPWILVAEDNLAGQKIAVAILEKLGYYADAAANGAEAIQALRRREYAAVLMDCEMPGLDGYEATRLIRRQETGALDPAVPIIALTADAMPGDREKCLQAGMNDYLAKPIGMHKLSETLAAWTASFHKGAAVEPAPAATRTVFDEESLLHRLMGDRTIAHELIKNFVQDIPQRLTSLRSTVEQRNMEGARLHAHALKGAAANLSAVTLHRIAVEMQQASTANDMERSVELLPRLEAEFEELKAALVVSGWTGWQGAGQV